MSIRDEIIDYISFLITILFILPFLSLLLPYLSDAEERFGAFVVVGLIIPVILHLESGCILFSKIYS
jgi:hypothetical protein